jgi:predicted NUDIX family phosphoesterase
MNILAIPTNEFYQGFTPAKQMGKLTLSYARLADKDTLETDPRFKQIITYCVVRHRDQILTYRRGKSGAEARLHDKYSVGIGGHVDEPDFSAVEIEDIAKVHPLQIFKRIQQAALREIMEETKLLISMESLQFIGWVNDDSDDVGKVHLGLVFLVDLNDRMTVECEPCLKEAQFTPLGDVVAKIDVFEKWSQIVIRRLDKRCE